MTKQQELAFYKRALRHFRISRFIPFCYPFHTGDGFCRYFAENGTNFWKLDTLWCMYESRRKYTTSSWWFKYHDLKSRINVLKQAIKILENETLPTNT